MTEQEAWSLVNDHLELVEAIARRIARAMPRSVELDDMIQEGRIGLLQAAERYEAGRGVPFEHFAGVRIKGAIIDAFRRRNYHYELHGELEDVHEDPAELPEATVHRKHVRREVERALDMLPDAEREAVVRHAKGESYREIGIRQDRSITWAFYTTSCGHKTLRERLKHLRGR